MHYDSIRDLSARIQTRKTSPVDAVEACLRRIEALNPRLNAFITVLSIEARDHAKAAEAEIKAGKWRGPLHGVPVAVKDFYDTAGIRTTAGFKEFKDRVPADDAEAVKKLKRAGAIIVGKTNMDSLGMATTGLTSHFGPVRNPWNNDYVSGGSSAGSAVAVAAGMCCATLDTDAVGSVRLPAACCGVVGFKGSYGLISLKGILADAPVDDFIRWMAHGAVITHSIGDTALVLNAVTDRADQNYADDLERPDMGVRIGAGDNFRSCPEVEAAFDQAVVALRSAGYVVTDVAVPFGDPSQGDMANIEADRAGVADRAFADVDIILLPTLETTVPAIKDAAQNPEQGVAAENTAFANYYGLPVVSVPCGTDSHGLPIGLQIVGKPGHERTVLDVACQYERIAKFGSWHPIA
jgi:aspartyl-tRNA(Asn)/glutamyl-tRNA(Gln) amidotransferase subunit A